MAGKDDGKEMVAGRQQPRTPIKSEAVTAVWVPGACLKRVRSTCDCLIKVSIIIFPIFLIAGTLVGIVVFVRARALKRPPPDAADMGMPKGFRGLGPTAPPDEDMDTVNVYGIFFLVMAIGALVTIFLGRCVTDHIPAPIPVRTRVDRDTGMHLQV